jgi:hypothetical protein
VKQRTSKILAATVLAGAALGVGPTRSEAFFPDLSASRIHPYVIPVCEDRPGDEARLNGLRIRERLWYDTPSAGTYRIRASAYTDPDNGLVAVGPYRDITVSSASTDIVFPAWTADLAYRGKANVTAFVFKWVGGANPWQLVARESFLCT